MAAGACVRAGKRDCAFEWLEKGFQDRDDLLVTLKADPVLDGIRTDRRFQDLLRRVGLPQLRLGLPRQPAKYDQLLQFPVNSVSPPG
jgi:hypothetical protein